MTTKPARNGAPWTEREEAIAVRLFGRLPTASIARRLQRTEGAVVRRIKYDMNTSPRIWKIRPTRKQWIEAVHVAARQTAIPAHEIMRRCQDRRIVLARALAFKHLHQQGCSLPGIGSVAGYHHTTVLNGLKLIAEPDQTVIAHREAA